MPLEDTFIAHAQIMASAKKLFIEKKAIYGDSWQLMDIHYIANRIMVKCERITCLISGVAQQVGDDIPTELTDIINYALIALMQLKRGGQASSAPITDQATLALYDGCVEEINTLLKQKNNDYSDAWKKMQYPSLITQIKIKLSRVLNQSPSSIQEDPSNAIDQYKDITNYAVFAIIHPKAPYNR